MEFFSNLSKWWPYIQDTLNIHNTVAPYFAAAWHSGQDIGANLKGAAVALWERNILGFFDVVPRAFAVSTKLNLGFSLFGWELLVFSVPVLLTDYIGYRRKCEFPEIFLSLRWPLQLICILLLIYGIQFFGRREGNAFIYFAF